MKKNLIIFIPLFILLIGITKAQKCYPDQDGNYIYYVNLKNIVENNIDKEWFISYLNNSEAFSQSKIDYSEQIEKVNKSFPTAVSDILQKSITLYSSSPDLAIELANYSDIFNFVEKVCLPEEKLLYEPNDYSINNVNHKKSHLELINASDAWNITKGDSRVLIGITDTYIETTHEDLQNKITQVIQNGNSHFHGIHVAGCAAAHTDNGTGIASIGFNSKIIFSSNWANDNAVLQMAQIQGVRVINCSWINSCSSNITTKALYEEIRDTHNVVIVAGAGNNSTHCGSNAYVYPASYESVISVTSVGHISDVGYVDPIYGANNWKDCHEEVIGDASTTHHHNDKVNISAPGYNVISTGLNNTYSGSWGTSFASPIVAGVSALVASLNPCLTAVEIQNIVLSSADPSLYSIPENSNYIGLLGTGRVDALEAVRLARESGAMYIQNKTYNSTIIETAETTVYSGENVTNTLPAGVVNINGGADVTFEATHSIVLSGGFEVQNNANFEAKIIDSNCY